MLYLIALNMHTRCDSPGRGIGPSHRPVRVQHTTFTKDKHPCPRRDSNPQSHAL